MDLDLASDLKKIFSEVRSDPQSLQVYGKDWTTYYDIKPSAIVFPVDADEVVKLVQWARKNKVGLIPSGGRTGLSGGACALNGEVIVSFERINQILEFNPIDQTVRVGAGVTTEQVQIFAAGKGLYYPVDFAARGSSQIGGNIATNAGGIKVIRYGLTRDWVASLKFVSGAGELMELNQSLIKNASGYDLRQLIIGSEGTLGFVVEATLRLTSTPPALQVFILGFKDLPSVMNVFSDFQKATKLVAFEMFSIQALEKVLANTGLPRPMPGHHPFYVLVEVEATDKALPVFENGVEKGWIVDGVESQSAAQAKNFWRLREDISESLAKFNPYKNDISVKISDVPQFVDELDAVLKQSYPNWEVIWFGHIGDGNLHINILRPSGLSKEEFVKECQKVDAMVFQVVKKFRGSISAEHGVGLSKKPFLEFSRSKAEIELMKGIKKVFDPDNIMNPGKLL